MRILKFLLWPIALLNRVLAGLIRALVSAGDQSFEIFAASIKTSDHAATINRVLASQHVKDLRWIVRVALGAIVTTALIGLILSLEGEAQKRFVAIHTHDASWYGWMERFFRALTNPHVLFSAAAKFSTFFGPTLALFGALVAWAYQTASARLGVVDLFACEITTLCRVATVLDTVSRLAERFGHGPPVRTDGDASEASNQFASQEDYFPVFNSNARDLQSLEARVVINITAFYTYMKAMRDSLRKLGENRPASSEAAATIWRESTRNAIFMLYLALESARRATRDLVEFEPEEAERGVVILISELAAYRFLRDHFPDKNDVRRQRLNLRETEYRSLVPELCAKIEEGKDQEDRRGGAGGISVWQPAWLLLPELRARFEVACACKIA